MNNKILTMGSFDMFHAGHSSLLNFCSKVKGEHGVLHVGVNSDDFMTAYKRPPIIPYSERAEIIFNHPFVDKVFPVTQHDASGIIRDGKYDILVIGEDWAHKDYFTQIGTSRKSLKQMEVTLIYKAIDFERTTTQTIEEIKNREF